MPKFHYILLNNQVFFSNNVNTSNNNNDNNNELKMSGAMAIMMRGIAGPQLGTMRFNDYVASPDATTISGNGTIAAVSQYCPWDEVDTAVIIGKYTYADWSRLNITFNPGPAAYGRAITVFCGWTNEGAVVPTTVKEFSRLKGFWTATFGGAGDPVTAKHEFPCPFDQSLLDILKCGNLLLGGRAMFNYCFVESDFGSTQVAGDEFSLVVSGEYNVFGQE